MLHKIRRASTRSDGESGISMVETAIVTLVVAIITAFALPAIGRSVRAYNLRSAGNHMAERMSAVRALALAKNRNVTFCFNNSSGRYGFDFTAPPDGVPDTTDPDEPSLNYYWETLPDGITATFPGNAPILVTFNSRGEMPIGSTEQTIVLQRDGSSVTVRVNLRGKISVE